MYKFCCDKKRPQQRNSSNSLERHEVHQRNKSRSKSPKNNYSSSSNQIPSNCNKGSGDIKGFVLVGQKFNESDMKSEQAGDLSHRHHSKELNEIYRNRRDKSKIYSKKVRQNRKEELESK